MTDHQHPTAKPEGEGAPPATYGDKGRALYEAFWKRNGGEVPSWNDQAQAIRSMWMSIARDAEPLYASPPVPAVALEAAVRGEVQKWSRTQFPRGCRVGSAKWVNGLTSRILAAHAASIGGAK